MSSIQKLTLTPAEENFVSCVISGVGASEAYRQCIPHEHDALPNTLNQRAKRLMDTTKVKNALFLAEQGERLVPQWMQDYGMELQHLNEVIRLGMIPDDNEKRDLSSVLSAIGLQIKIKSQYKSPDGRLKRIVQMVDMKEKGIVDDEALAQAVRAELV